MPAVTPGAQFPTKKLSYNDEEIAQLAAYVASLGPGPAIPDAADYTSEGLFRLILQLVLTALGLRLIWMAAPELGWF